MNTEPKSLQEAIVYFSNPDNCIAHLVAQRWPDGKVNARPAALRRSTIGRTGGLWTCSSHHGEAGVFDQGRN